MRWLYGDTHVDEKSANDRRQNATNVMVLGLLRTAATRRWDDGRAEETCGRFVTG